MILYDYIIAGGGASGLMLAYRMSKDSYFDDKQIIIIDKEEKNTNDRTWCFWEKGLGEWDHLLSKSWEEIYFGSPAYSNVISLNDYRYKMIRSADFYNFLKSELSQKPNFQFVTNHIENIEDQGNTVHITTKGSNYVSKKVFSSIFDASILIGQTSFPYLKQHFVGWFVKTKKAVFNEHVAGFMDFNIPQNNNTRFMYVLPTSPYEALVEYTLFSENLLEYEAYESEIRKYLFEKYKQSDFEITEKEQGNIPMTCYPLFNLNTSNIMYIGSAGGWTKASTGFTFANTMRYSVSLAHFLKENSDLKKFKFRSRYWYYDLIFLDVLHKNNELGSTIFSSIFANNNIETILRFLDERGSLLQDLSILMKTKPTLNFTKSALSNLKLLFTT